MLFSLLNLYLVFPIELLFFPPTALVVSLVEHAFVSPIVLLPKYSQIELVLGCCFRKVCTMYSVDPFSEDEIREALERAQSGNDIDSKQKVEYEYRVYMYGVQK